MALRSSSRRGATLAVAVAVVATVAAALKGRLTRFEVAEDSMQPALHPGDFLVALLTVGVRRGDIVIYPDPTAHGRDLVKRVVGLPGESLTIGGGQVAIDGAVLAEPWADGPTLPDGTWTIPAGSVFTLGDNRSSSSGDGRASGPVPVTGLYRVVWRYWPPRSIGRI